MQKGRASPTVVGQDTYPVFPVVLTCSQHISTAWILMAIKANGPG